ncbi:hypothetical protein CISIN_1g040038mg [Citrus sinensis]|uniref:Uncharacterized protein n=1 Tax=Citrus sinensis TaxID=2711 RepID=A0A067DI03_CITSI|nr:hypothetical protein CISIN_1g040038mg [Citrus sinensis]
MIIVVTMNAADTVAAFVMLFLRLSSIYPIILQVIHPFDAQANGELSLSIDDYVVARQVLSPLNNNTDFSTMLLTYPSNL